MHLAPLTGIETIQKRTNLQWKNDASRAPYGDWNYLLLDFEIYYLDASRAPYGDWNEDLDDIAYKYDGDASRAPYGDWNSFLLWFIFLNNWCISRPLRGLKLY